MSRRGMALPELMIAIGIGALVLGMLVALFLQGLKLVRGEDPRSQALRELARGMRLLSGTLSEGSVYVVGPLDHLHAQECATSLEVEQFRETEPLHRRIAITLSNGELLETTTLPGLDASAPAVRRLARGVTAVRFCLPRPTTLDLTLEADGLRLNTQVPTLRVPEERAL